MSKKMIGTFARLEKTVDSNQRFTYFQADCGFSAKDRISSWRRMLPPASAVRGDSFLRGFTSGSWGKDIGGVIVFCIMLLEIFSSPVEGSVKDFLDYFDQQATTQHGSSRNQSFDLGRWGKSVEEWNDSLKQNYTEIKKDFKKITGNEIYTCKVGIGDYAYTKGDTLYHFSFDNPSAVGGHGESELEWEIDNHFLGIDVSLSAKDKSDPTREKAVIRFEWVTNVDSPSGLLKDSDWIENDVGYIDYQDDGVLNGSASWVTNNSGKDIYSESDSQLDDSIFSDIEYIYYVFSSPQLRVGLSAGYHYEDYQFSATNLRQVGYGPYGPGGAYDQTYTDVNNWKWIEYKTSQKFPFLGTSLTMRVNDKVRVSCSLRYSGWVDTEEQDTHLYPLTDVNTGINVDMITKGSSEGDVFVYGVDVAWQCSSRWGVFIGGEWLDLDAKGYLVQHTYYDGVLTTVSSSIDNIVKTEYWKLYSRLIFTF